MKTFTIKQWAHSTLAAVALLGASVALAQSAGSVVTLGNPNHGAPYAGLVVSGPDAGNSFASFCIDKAEFFNLGENLYVQGLTDHTTNAANSPVQLRAQTAWLFTQYTQDANFRTNNNAMQNALWSLQGEPTTPALDATATGWINLANAAVSGGSWSGLGGARVMNLYKDAGYTLHAQDQLVMTPVPEPERYVLMLLGMGFISAVARRRNEKVMH